jgi:sortase A
MKEFRGVTFSLDKTSATTTPTKDHSPFGFLLSKYPPIKVTPVNQDYSIIIEKIGVNAPIVSDVDVAKRSDYMEALKHGVAEAAGSVHPGEVGNTYLFAHSALDFWDFGPYALVFTLLNRVENGDRVVLFYRGQRYDYTIANKEIVKGFNTEPLGRQYDSPTLTIQTCDPPGTALNRLIVTAKLVKVGY